MSWKHLLAEHLVEPHTTSAEEIRDLRAAVDRNLHDARLQGLSNDNRFGLAYEAALVAAKMAVHAAGYRVRPIAGDGTPPRAGEAEPRAPRVTRGAPENEAAGGGFTAGRHQGVRAPRVLRRVGGPRGTRGDRVAPRYLPPAGSEKVKSGERARISRAMPRIWSRCFRSPVRFHSA